MSFRVEGPGNININTVVNKKTAQVERADKDEPVVRPKLELIPNLEPIKATKIESPYAYVADVTSLKIPVVGATEQKLYDEYLAEKDTETSGWKNYGVLSPLAEERMPDIVDNWMDLLA